MHMSRCRKFTVSRWIFHLVRATDAEVKLFLSKTVAVNETGWDTHEIRIGLTTTVKIRNIVCNIQGHDKKGKLFTEIKD